MREYNRTAVTRVPAPYSHRLSIADRTKRPGGLKKLGRLRMRRLLGEEAREEATQEAKMAEGQVDRAPRRIFAPNGHLT